MNSLKFALDFSFLYDVSYLGFTSVMGNFNLYPHNKESYKQIRLAISSGEKRIALIQATGTGKSYNALTLILDYQNKKTLYVVPSLSIVEHLQEVIVNSGFSLEKDFPNLNF